MMGTRKREMISRGGNRQKLNCAIKNLALDIVSLQVHSRLTSGIAAWKQYDVHYTDLELGADQCKKRLDEFQGTPMATSPQEVADGITQLNVRFECCWYALLVLSVDNVKRHVVSAHTVASYFL
jgi:hypothetical protein